MRVDLGSDQWADLKELSELNSGDKRAVLGSVDVEVAVMDDGTKRQIYPGDYNYRMQAGLAKRIVLNWSLPKPLPKIRPSVLDELSIEQYDALADAFEPYIAKINGDEPGPEDEGSVPTTA